MATTFAMFVVAIGLSACGSSDAGGDTTIAPSPTATQLPVASADTEPATTAAVTTVPAESLPAPATTSPAPTTVATTVTTEAFVVTNAEVAELEQQLDEIDQLLAGIDADLSQD